MPAKDTATTQRRRHYSEKSQTGAIEGSEYSVVPVLALLTTVCSYSATLALRGTNVHTKRARTGFSTGVDMSRKVRDSRTKPSTVQVVVVHIHLD